MGANYYGYLIKLYVLVCATINIDVYNNIDHGFVSDTSFNSSHYLMFITIGERELNVREIEALCYFITLYLMTFD